ncbi:O-antigen ligase family protein [Paenibacillus cineris]|uniref:O-antigen ligase-related domain-containing protein n=1 Tax=Paenibacillus cineris TaxID=237530 RepID=A0ABQ4L7I9_9BACL|nr:O-antigen ligase family protein [Paenibacillus cineris]GIO52452.1 hypothetical protein J21TS7_07700 [Paenibacillus cineris]
MIYTIGIIILVFILSWWRPEVGLAVSVQSYLIRSALNPAVYSDQTNNTSDDPILSVVLPAIIFGVIIIKMLQRKNEHLRFNIRLLDSLFFVLGAVLLFGALYSPFKYDAILVTLKFFVLGISYYYFGRLYFSKHEDVTKAAVNFMITTWILAIILGSYAYIKSYGIDYFRLTIGNAHPIPFSLLIASGILINVYWLFKPRPSKLQRVILFVTFFVLLVIFISANTRGTIISLAVSLLFMFLASLIQKKVKLRQFLIGIISLFGVLYLIANILPDTTETVKKNLELIVSSDHGVSINERSMAHSDALKLFNDHIMFGVGTAGFKKYSQIDYAHNAFLEIISENGLIGGITLGLVFLVISSILLKIMIRQNGLTLLIASLVVLNMVEMQFSFTLWMHKWFFLFCGLLVSVMLAQKKSEKPPIESRIYNLEKYNSKKFLRTVKSPNI